MKNRKLQDLYVLGKDITLDDGAGDPVTVYIRKMNPVDQEVAVRRANAARARVLAAVRNKESDEYADVLAQAMDIGNRNELISFLNVSKLANFRAAREAELAAEEEWSKDGYLQGLFDAWNGGLNKVYATEPEDSEAKRVFDEMKRFTDEVDKLVEHYEEELNDTFSSYSLTELQENVAEEMATMNGDSFWVKEFRRCEIWLCVRDPENHQERYFEDRSEIDQLSAEVMNRLMEELRNLTVDPLEGKDLPLTDTSSTSSEPSEAEEALAPSGQLAAVQ